MSRPTGTADTPQSRSAYYRQQCGLPVTVRPGGHIVAKADSDLAGFTMPVELGELVKAEMRTRNVPWGPIVAHVRARRWMFLVDWETRDDIGVSLDSEMMRSNVSVVRPGGEIAFPSPAPSSIQREWIVNPNSRHRPSAGTVLEVIRHCVRRRDCRRQAEVSKGSANR
ncbi:DNA-directed RNA polymerase subunit beta [Nocardia sp. NBC_01327]|uniref:DNA-directed RNA polymerase subunit beta n=1 Tax=Nocardia sp. NBC_01327 TaxID=2903593 RepID=UPI002E15671C|nr:DNA-directed RNA polymerase subunit beta [Nocardia sp. NBC_01327]